MKHFLIEDLKIDAADVKIKWSKMEVEVKKVRVVWFDAEQDFCAEGVGTDLKSKVVTKAAEWLEKRQQ